MMMDLDYPRHTLAGAALLLVAMLAAGPLPAADFDPARLGWQAAEFRATKLFMTAEADLAVDLVDARTRLADLMEPGEGTPIPPAASLLVMRTTSRGFGRETETELLLDPGDGAAVQRTTHDSGSKFRHRIYRFTEQGAFHRSWWPETGEEQQPWDTWSERSEGLRAYPPDLPAAPISEPTALLYLIAASPLAVPGDRTEVLTFARRAVHRVTAEVISAKPIRYAYRDTTSGEEHKGRMTPIRIRLHGDTLGDDEDDFELLGLSGDIDLYLDPDTRAPLQLSGRIRLAGAVDFRLAGLTRAEPDRR
jgi:hypothetical protein